jgi:hypothetical protein
VPIEKWRRPLGGLMLLLWVTSLLTPAVQLCAVHSDMVPQFSRSGLWFLASGVLAIFGIGPLGWLANPLMLVAAVILLGRHKPWLLLSVACLAFAVLGWWQSYRTFDFDGGPYRHCGTGLGLWLWLASSVVPLALHGLERFARPSHFPLQESD